MMECQICGDREGPWEYAQYISEPCMECNERDITCKMCSIDEFDPKNYNGHAILVCEDCAKVLKKRIKNKEKKYGTAYLRNKRHVGRISRSDRGSK